MNTEKEQPTTLLELFKEWKWIDELPEETTDKPKRPTRIKTARFVACEHSGYLECPHCQTKYTQHGNDGIINPSCSSYWEEMSDEKWYCPNCKKRFALPTNPFAQPTKGVQA